MEIGIGLPTNLDGVDRQLLLEWSRRAEARGFSSLAVFDRVVYRNYEPLMTLSAAAAITTRIRLMPAVLLGPPRRNTALFAKQTASLDNLSGGRLVLGLGVGSRPDDYSSGGADFRHRGRTLDQQFVELRRSWSGEGGVGPAPVRTGGPEIIVGGMSAAAVARVARAADGWIAGGAGYRDFEQGARRIREAWSAAGRAGTPRLLAIVHFALGERGEQDLAGYVGHHYAYRQQLADATMAGSAGNEDRARLLKAELERLGCDEAIFMPCSSDVAQVDLLAEALG
jgi:alkanesulfonate monooxygenase SsuD/methylene tetrahydromethanopterin reductase-like flavin-dependent oxidoreductase (luciferase family)